MPRIAVCHADNLAVLRKLPDACVDLIYIDPPFNTGKVQQRTRLSTVRDDNGDRVGFKGQIYRTIKCDTLGYADRFDDFLGFLQPRMEEAFRILKPQGSLFFHLDYREIHYCKVMLDGIFGRASFINEIIWAYDYGARSRCRWPAKHDNILWYAKDPENYTFNFDEMDRIPYMAPGLVSPNKAERGKTPTDVWWHTIVSPNGKEKTGYATQKPRGIVDRIVKVHSKPGDVLCDFFAGSGTLGESAAELGRSALLVDSNIEAVHTMKSRFSEKEAAWYRGAVHAVEALDYVRIAALEDASRPQVPARQEKKKEKRVKVKASTTAKRTAAVQETQIIVCRKSSGPAAKNSESKRGTARSGHRGVRRIAGLNEGAAPERAEE
ncbi:MAG: site-specific DNA-methyltransferase [Mailhella sp.]|nr:site-specific DNA-methyltransferase [Mailhella sp.]